MLGFIAACFNTVFILVAYTPIEDGGLDMNVCYRTTSSSFCQKLTCCLVRQPQKIATALSIMGLVSIGLKASLPIFLRRYDALTVFRFTLWTWPVTLGLIPILNIIARHGSSAKNQALLWVAVTIVLFMSRLGSLAFSYVLFYVEDGVSAEQVR
jgi:hypothetical protein